MYILKQEKKVPVYFHYKLQSKSQSKAKARTDLLSDFGRVPRLAIQLGLKVLRRQQNLHKVG